MPVIGQSADSLKTTTASDPALDGAREYAVKHKLSYAGGLYPPEAWRLFNEGLAVLIDVRSAEERKFVGHVPGSIHVAWQAGLSLTKNPRFIGELSTKIKKDTPVLFLCRSGKRSAAAAEAATKAGFSNVFNVLEGFEGEIDEQQQRGKTAAGVHTIFPGFRIDLLISEWR